MDQKNILTRIALNAWQTYVDRTTEFFNQLTEKELLKEIVPGKNRGIYLLGHLAAIHDVMPEILGFGKRAYPDLQGIFVKAPDKSISQIPPVSELKTIWTAVNERLKNEFAVMTADAWFMRHESMTDADFEKEPSRNKLSVLLNRTNHLAFHFGQLRLLK